MSATACSCFIALHPRAADIEAALVAGDSPRDVAVRFGVGKSKVYEHRRHLGITERPVRRVPTLEAGAPPEAPALVLAEAPPDDPSRPVDSDHGHLSAADKEVSAGCPPRSVDGPGPPRAQPQPVESIERSYDAAVSAALDVINAGRWRASEVERVASRFGISTDRARRAFQEAARYLRRSMGDYVEKQAVSASYAAQHRDDCRARSESTRELADAWREREREALDDAEQARQIGDSGKRGDRLNDAARFGLVAAKYGLEAEKWAAQALNAQRHMDDILCLKTPTAQLHATQINVGGGDGKTELEAFANALAARFARHPEILAAIEEAAAAIEHGQPGDESAIVTTGEAA